MPLPHLPHLPARGRLHYPLGRRASRAARRRRSACRSARQRRAAEEGSRGSRSGPRATWAKQVVGEQVGVGEWRVSREHASALCRHSKKGWRGVARVARGGEGWRGVARVCCGIHDCRLGQRVRQQPAERRGRQGWRPGTPPEVVTARGQQQSAHLRTRRTACACACACACSCACTCTTCTCHMCMCM